MLGKVGPYELIEEIGSGGMATVFRARQESMGRFVAVKVIHQGISLDRTAVERFQREARLIAQLEHPHILPVYDYNGANNPPYIVMRYMPTGTLKDIMMRARLPMEDVGLIYRQLGGALDYAHRKGVIHRDIKPSNIMIDGEGNIFLTDFGIARMRDESQNITGTGLAVGTPGYMAPEQTLGLEIDSRVDVYALGVMLFELVTGRAPFLADTPMAVMLKHISDPIPSPCEVDPSCPKEMEPIIEKALAKKPEERYQSAGELARALAELIRAPVSRSNMLAELAQETITDIKVQQENVSQATQLKTAGTGTPFDEAKTVLTTGSILTVSNNKTRGYVLMGVLLAVLIVAAGLFFLSTMGDDGDENGSNAELSETQAQERTSTAQAVAAAIEGTTTAQSQSVATDEATDIPVQIETSTVEVAGVPSDAPVSNTPASTETDVPTDIPTNTPTDTPTDAPTNTPTDIPTATETAVDARARVVVGRGLIYAEPNPRAVEVVTVPEGAGLLVTGISQDGQWYQVDFLGSVGWILAAQIEVGGNLQTIALVVPSETPTPTPTETPTLTPTSTPTDTPTATPTATSTSTPVPSATPTTVQVTATPMATFTPIPAGALPYIADMESSNPLSNWEYLPEQWQVRTDGGNTALFGTTGFDNSLTILGREVPEWVQPGQDDLLINFRINLLDPNSGGRFIFKFTPQNGYYVVEMLSGLIIFKRGQAGPAPDRPNERELGRVSGANITNNRWYEFTIWSEGSRTYIYQDKDLILKNDDRGLPLAPGSILLQTFSSQANPVGWDDFVLQHPEDASDHFEGASFPTTWQRSSEQNVTLGSDSTTQFIDLVEVAEVQPITPPLDNFIMYAGLNNTMGGFEMFVRESAQGSLKLDWYAGNVDLSQLDAAGQVIYTETLRNFYGRGVFKPFVMTAVGERITIYDGSDIILERDLPGLPAAGFIRFTTQAGDGLRIDDFLVAATDITSTADATFAFDVLAALETRPMRDLRWDWSEDFSERFRTRGFWEGDLEGDPGEYVIDETVPLDAGHRRYYVLQSAEFPAWRRIRPEIDGTGTVFGRGEDRANFRDSADIYVQIFMRLPESAPIGSQAWVGVRTEPTASGGLTQYKVSLIKGETGQTIIRVAPETQTDRTTIYEETLDTTDWTEIIVVALDDRIAFFNDGRLMAVIRSTELLSGTVAIGVEPNSLAHFDDLIIRDTSVNE